MIQMRSALTINRREFLRLGAASGLLALLGPSACAPIPEPAKPNVSSPAASLTLPPMPPRITPSVSSSPTIPPSKDTSSPLFVISMRQNTKAAWEERVTRTLAGVRGALDLAPDSNLNQYGGLKTRAGKRTGFFHAEKIGGRWWLVDPDGNLFIHKGVTSVAIQDTSKGQAAFKTQFGNSTRASMG
jgi:hypothetical protein